MAVKTRSSTRHMKGKQVPLTVYLPPKKYWLLKWISDKSGLSMQHFVRSALEDVIEREYHRVERRLR